MKRISIEQAETMPTKLGMRWEINKVNNTSVITRKDWKNHSYEITWSHLYRFILKHVGKYYDTCFSNFIHWVNTERRVSKGISRKYFIDNFHYMFREGRYFDVNDEGIIIKKGSRWIKRKNKVPRYSSYAYKIKDLTGKEYHTFLLYWGRDITERAVKGLLSDKEYHMIITDQEFLSKFFIYNFTSFYVYNMQNYFRKVGIGEPLTKTKYTQAKYEEWDQLKKKWREYNKQREINLAHLNFGHFDSATKRRKKEKEERRRLAKLEEEENNIHRDRLGFDETSFKTIRI